MYLVDTIKFMDVDAKKDEFITGQRKLQGPLQLLILSIILRPHIYIKRTLHYSSRVCSEGHMMKEWLDLRNGSVSHHQTTKSLRADKVSLPSYIRLRVVYIDNIMLELVYVHNVMFGVV